jgi:hypothetical protein
LTSSLSLNFIPEIQLRVLFFRLDISFDGSNVILTSLPLRRRRWYVFFILICPAVILIIFSFAVWDLEICC